MKTELSTNLRATWARAYVRIIGANRELSWIFFDTFLPFLATAAYVYVYKALHAPADFAGFVLIGGAMIAFWMTVLWSMANQFYWEKEMGNLELYMIAPISMMSILMGMAIGGLFMTLVRASAVLVLGSLFFGVNFTIGSYPLLVVVFLLTMTALFALGMAAASLFMLIGRGALQLSVALQEPIYLCSGFYFPVKQLGAIVAFGASIVPLTLGLDAMRQLTFTEGLKWRFLPLGWEIAALALLSAVFLPTSAWTLRKMEDLGRRDGRLIVRWQ